MGGRNGARDAGKTGKGFGRDRVEASAGDKERLRYRIVDELGLCSSARVAGDRVMVRRKQFRERLGGIGVSLAHHVINGRHPSICDNRCQSTSIRRCLSTLS